MKLLLTVTIGILVMPALCLEHKQQHRQFINGEIVITQRIIEVPLSAFIKTNTRLHYMVGKLLEE